MDDGTWKKKRDALEQRHSFAAEVAFFFSPLCPKAGPAGLLKIPMGRDVGPAAEVWPEPVT